MFWKECHVMDERLRVVARLLEGEKMAPLCAEFSGFRARPATRSTTVTKIAGSRPLATGVTERIARRIGCRPPLKRRSCA